MAKKNDFIVCDTGYEGVAPFPSSKVDFKNKKARINDYLREFFNRTNMMFEYEGLPETITKRQLELMLQSYGFVCWYKHNDGLYVFRVGLGGLPNEYFMPTKCTLANPYFKLTKILDIGKDCVIMRNDATYTGLYPLLSKYANLLVENDITIYNALVNVRMPSLVSVKDDRTKASAETYFKNVENGDLGIIGESAFLDGLKSQPYNQQTNNSLTQLIEMKQYIKASLFNELGLNSNYNMKRESINSNESQLNDDMLHPLIDDMLKSRQECLDEVNKMFGTNIKVKYGSAWLENEKEHEQVLDGLDNNDVDETPKEQEPVEDGDTNE